MSSSKRNLQACLLLALSLIILTSVSKVHAQASQFYVFAVKELEGVSQSIPAQQRPLIDTRVRDLLSAEVQTRLVDGFSRRLAEAYPASVMHAKQIGNSTSTKGFRFVDDDSQQCRDNFFVPVQQAYAAVLGITRGSWYEVKRERGVVELLIPITLNLQVVKPDLAKVVYSISETLYTPFRFGSAEELSKSVKTIVTDDVVTGLEKQLTELVGQLKNGFQPKQSIVTIVGRSSDVYVVDKGFEVGFVDGDQPTAVNRKTGGEVYFSILAAESGYSILRPTQGEVSVGDSFSFQFEAPADDSRKPRVMPIVSLSQADVLSSAMSDLFAKNIGFGAPFQIAAVDANFKDTQDIIERRANCVAWDKFAAVRKDFESRKDAPDYFLRFEHTFTPVLFESGQGGVETRESFAATVGVQLVDVRGNVLHSEIGQDFYRLEKRGGRGLDINNAKEVALKNSTTAAAKKFISNLKFQPGEFEITAADKSSFTVKGLPPLNGTEVAIDVIRPLDTKINGKPTFWRIAFDRSEVAPIEADGNTLFKYTARDSEIRRGDRIVISNLPRRGQTRLSECPTHYVAADSSPADFLVPVVKHAAYGNQKYQVTLANPDFYSNATALLQEGKFKLKVAPPEPTESCIRPGYLVRPDSPACAGDLCAFDLLAASTVIIEKAGQRVGNFVQAERINVKGAASPQVANFVALKAAESVSKNLPKLVEKLNLGK
jgi:hypothetical protein